ncbi:MAG: heavy metal-responsive transcriptional regulator [Acidimicrobiales bacterium]
MKIGELASRTGVPVKTLRYYEQIGVIDHPARTSSGYREYDDEVIDRLAFIRASQSVGFTLGEIREVLAFRDRGDVPCGHVLELLRQHREESERRIAALELVRKSLDDLVDRAAGLRVEDCSADDVCHLIPRLTETVVRRASDVTAPARPSGVGSRKAHRDGDAVTGRVV